MVDFRGVRGMRVDGICFLSQFFAYVLFSFLPVLTAGFISAAAHRSWVAKSAKQRTRVPGAACFILFGVGCSFLRAVSPSQGE